MVGSMAPFLQRLFDGLQRFRSAKGGNVIIPFTLLLVPILGAVGAAVDYSRANSDKAAMQAAVDATALMLSKNAATLTTAQINQQATNYFTSLFSRTDVTNMVISPTYTTSGGTQIVLTATGMVGTTFMKVLGFSTITVSVSSTVKWGNTRLRVALVLDNTGSMAQSNKMTALKTASHNLLTQLQNAAGQNGDVYVSIVPFTKDVNVDPVNYSQTWVRWDDGTDASWDGTNGSCSKPGYSPRSSCVSQGSCSKSGYTSQSACTAQGSCSKSGQTTQSSCASHSGTWTPATWTGATWTPNNHNTWIGCVTDRDQNFDTTNDAPAVGTSATLFPTEQYSVCPVPLMSLSYDWLALSTKIDAMQPNGNTNQAIGLQWGWQSLTAAPFTIPPMDPLYKYQQVIILLTDGLNTQDRWYTTQSSIDARQQKSCDNINAAGITLYTVQVNTSGDPTSTLLQNCAGSPGHYPDSSKFFLLTSSTEIVTTFNQIGTALASLYVAK
jgi:Flp pilus assembly protein TadG